MSLKKLISEDSIILDCDYKTKEEVIRGLVNKLYEERAVTSKEEFYKVVMEREKLSPTGLEEGLAIPHGKSEYVKTARIAVARLKTSLEDWESIDEANKVKLVFLIAIPKKEEGTTHIDILTRLSTSFMEEGFIEKLQNSKTKEEFLEVIYNVEKKGESEAKIHGNTKYIIGVTACPVGIAHTYMAASSLEKKGEQLGYEVKIETNGSVGIKNGLTKEDIERADGIILAIDKTIEMSRFFGKKIIQVSVKEAIKNPEELINKALRGEGEIYLSEKGELDNKKNENKKVGIYKHLMNGVSNMLPLVVCGGVLIALSIALSGIKAGSGADVTNPFFKEMLELGVTAFGLMIPILAGYIAMSIADRPGLAPGLIGGALATKVGAGFLGGIVAGFAAGYIARWVKEWKVPESLRPIMPIFVIPLVASSLVGVVMYFIGTPITGFMNMLTEFLKGLQSGSIVLALILGLMIAFDMGGPVNKVAFLFGSAMITQGVPEVMGPVAVAICIPPLGMGVATLLSPKKYETEEREAGKAALAMGMIGVTEGAIPFAAADPLRVIPSIMIGSATGAVIAAIGKVTDHAPHGGPIVLPVVDNKLMFVIAIVVGVFVTAILVNTLKKNKKN
ncbi:MAG: PTS fructose transporter subunit IIABC [Fusobacteriaceae bacterium]